MSYWANKKPNKSKNYILNAKLRNVDYSSSKENIFGWTRPEAKRSDVSAQYLYVDPTYVAKVATREDIKRLKGGQYEQESYYDCQSLSLKEVVGDNQLACQNNSMHQQQSVSDVLSEIDNLKEFKRELKQMALSSNAIYRSFRQAYSKVKKANKSSSDSYGFKDDYCLKCSGQISCEKFTNETDRKDLNPFDIVNVVLPTNIEALCNKHEIKQKKPKTDPMSSQNAQQELFRYTYTNDTGPQTDANRLLQDERRLAKTNIYQPTDNLSAAINFCEKCGVSRENLPLHKNMQKETSINGKRDIIENSFQTDQSFGPMNTLPENLNEIPISITVPLVVQFDSQRGQIHIVDTAVVVQTSDVSVGQKNYIGPSILPVKKNSVTGSIQESDIFDSCTSKLNLKEYKTQGNQTSMEIPIAITSDSNMEIENELAVRPLTRLEDLRKKAEHLRTELVQEIKTALEKNPSTAVIHVLEEKKHSLLPADVKRKNEINQAANTNFSKPGVQRSIPSNSITSWATTSAQSKGIEPSAAKSNQTSTLALQRSSRYKRNEMRKEIQENLNELLQVNSTNTQQVYDAEERNAILLDLQKLFHPEMSKILSKQLRLEEALHGVRYIVEPEPPINFTTESIKLSETAVNILEDIKHILNLKTKHNEKSKYKKYHRQAKDKILEDLQTILKASKQRTPDSQEIRDSIVHDLHVMLNTCEVKISPGRFPRPTQFQQEMRDATSTFVNSSLEPSTSRRKDIQPQTDFATISELRDSLLSDLRQLLDATPQLRAENKDDQSNTSKDKTSSSSKSKVTFNNVTAIDSLSNIKKNHE